MDLWLVKAFEHHTQRDTDTCVMLIPFRPEMDYFKRLVVDTQATIFVLQGRIKFNGMKGTAPFPLVVIVWSNAAYDKDKFSAELNAWFKVF